MKGLYLAGFCLGAGLLIMACGCATSKKVETKQVVEPTPIPTIEPVSDKSPLWKENEVLETYKVQKGDCLWTIADSVYNDPFQWPTIWHENRAQISNPDVIEIEQVLVTPRNPDLVDYSRQEASEWTPYRRPKKSSK